jgi:hypothetical protein
VIPARYARLFAAAVMGAASISAANARDGFTTDGKQHHDGKHHHDGTYAVYLALADHGMRRFVGRAPAKRPNMRGGGLN